MIHVAVTGHRPNKLGGYNLNTPQYAALKNDFLTHIQYLLQYNDIVVGHSGMALGADTLWAIAILEAKKMFPNRVLLHAEIPFVEQPNAWFNKKDKDMWQMIRDNADFETIYAPDLIAKNAQKYEIAKILDDRNIGMVDHADEIIAIWDGSKSGTANAVNYASRKGKPVRRVHPSKYFN